MNTSKPTERASVLAILPPLSQTEARTSTLVPLTGSRRGVVKVFVGASTATAALTLLKATAATGATSAVASQQYGGAGTIGNNLVYLFNIDADEVSSAPYVGVSIGDSGTTLSAAIVEGFDARFGKEGDHADVTIVR